MTGRSGSGTTDAPVLTSLEDLVELIGNGQLLFVRYSKGPDDDANRESRDYESKLPLPGLSVNPLDPQPWWTRPLEDWVARQLCQYAHLKDDADDQRCAWVLTGRVVTRGPDNEPVIEHPRLVAFLSEELVEQAKALYDERFDVGRESTE
jgi:hypothetical protein